MSHKIMELVEKSSLKEEAPEFEVGDTVDVHTCLLYTSPSPRDLSTSRMPSSA